MRFIAITLLCTALLYINVGCAQPFNASLSFKTKEFAKKFKILLKENKDIMCKIAMKNGTNRIPDKLVTTMMLGAFGETWSALNKNEVLEPEVVEKFYKEIKRKE